MDLRRKLPQVLSEQNLQMVQGSAVAVMFAFQ